jgi:ribosome-associated protein
VSSRVTLWFDVVNSPGLSPEQKELVISRLKTRIGKDGLLRVISQQTRSQLENRELAVERFVELVKDAVRQVPIRKKTRVSKGAKLRRLEEKRQHSLLKSKRSKRVPVED